MLGMRVSCAKTAEPIKIAFEALTHVVRRNHVLDGSPDPPTERYIAKDDKTAIPLFQITLVKHLL